MGLVYLYSVLHFVDNQTVPSLSHNLQRWIGWERLNISAGTRYLGVKWSVKVEIQNFATGHKIAPSDWHCCTACMWLSRYWTWLGADTVLLIIPSAADMHNFGLQATGSSDCVCIWMEMYVVDHLVYRLDFCYGGSSTCKSSTLYNLHPVQEGVHLQEFYSVQFTPRPQQSHKGTCHYYLSMSMSPVSQQVTRHHSTVGERF